MNICQYLFTDGTTIPGIPRSAFVPGMPVYIDLDTLSIVSPEDAQADLQSESQELLTDPSPLPTVQERSPFVSTDDDAPESNLEG